MEWLLLLIAIGCGYWWYINKSPQSQFNKKAEFTETLAKEADEAYVFYSQKLDEMLKKDLPKWINEAKTNRDNWQKDFPGKKLPDILTWQPDKQALRKKDIVKDIDELERIKSKFVRIVLRYEHSKDIDMKVENLYDWHQWIVKKADMYNFRGFENMLYINNAEQQAWKIKFEEIEKRFDDRLR